MKEPPVTQNHTRHHQLLCLVLAMMEGNFQAPDTTLSPPVGLRKIRIQFLQPYYSSLPSVVPWKPRLEGWSILETAAYLFKPRMSYTILDLLPLTSLLQAESIENFLKKNLNLFLFFSPLPKSTISQLEKHVVKLPPQRDNWGFPGANAGDTSLIPGLVRSHMPRSN